MANLKQLMRDAYTWKNNPLSLCNIDALSVFNILSV